ncbi:MAG: cyclase family protein [Chloroflexota bacterium]
MIPNYSLRKHSSESHTSACPHNISWYSGTFLTRNHEEGEHFRQTTMLMGVHGFTHVDAPGHYVKGGPTIDQLPIDLIPIATKSKTRRDSRGVF